ncbi:MAG: YkuS family protein [Thermaerobacter sp.]|nr:YkuS family protein [Thermaerobacter sp.]
MAIEEGLEDVRQAIEDAGWEAIDLEEAALDEVDAVVCTGMDDDLLGDETTSTEVPVISADGLTAEEVVRRLADAPLS